MYSDKNELKVALPGGLIALGTTLDPSLGRADKLVGQVIGLPGEMPPVFQEVIVSYMLIDRVCENTALWKSQGDSGDGSKLFFRQKDELKLNIGSQTTTATVKAVKPDLLKLFLKIPCCTAIRSRVSISVKNPSGRWALVGVGMIRKGTPLEEIGQPS
jgi:translation initiation factor 2 subunit 3